MSIVKDEGLRGRGPHTNDMQSPQGTAKMLEKERGGRMWF